MELMKWGVNFDGECLFTCQHLAEVKYVFYIVFYHREKFERMTSVIIP